ncbi:hypothetical protein SAMN05444483_10889 [Salegentibacter echinorum]|uniref:Signal transduction histidine kinase internal region domain-containing protein n=1 Tax=Salegentibacter echinorum TaxID=1073325 RepID=A0A1M5IQP3_SALEC|nr:histidine kinase [Salegentibacter echinorum]SHG30536.1 hypothetical protein SAMN05444483_10889 [Salegentibacter echinorum]
MPFCKTTKLLLLIIFWFNFAFSQNYPTSNFTSATDLPNNSVRSLLVDSNNSLWIGTENGVVKKQNDEFQYFFEEDGLAQNSCWAIAEDNNNKLWFGSYGEGLSIYDGYEFEIISVKDGLVHNQITKLFSCGSYMYVGTSDGVSLIDVNTFQVKSLKMPATEELFRVQDFFEYQSQVYVVTYRTGIFRILNEDEKATLIKVNDHKFIYSVLKNNDSIYSSNKGFFTKSSLSDYLSDKDSIPLRKHGASIIWDYVKTGDHKIFAAAWGIYDANGGLYEVINGRLVSRASDFNVGSKEVISLAYDSKFEKLYAGTRDAGLFEIALNPKIKIHEISGNNILGFASTKNTSAVLLDEGITLKKDENEQIITLFQLKRWQEKYVLNTVLPLPKYKDDFYELDYTTKAENITFYDIKAFQDTYWINTNIGVFAIRESGELAHYLPIHSEEINFTAEGNLIETNPYGGLRVYSDLNLFKYKHFKKEDPQTPTMIVNSWQKGGKTYFLSVFSGLYVWENNRFNSYLENGIWNEKKLKQITGLGNDLAISNEFGDVFIVNDDKSFKIKEKIPRAAIQGNSISFLENYQGSLIIGTEKGLTLYKNGRSIFLDKEQGLEQPLLSAKVSGNALSVGSHNGYYTILLDEIWDEKALIEEIKLKELFINNNKASLESSLEKNKLKLKHDENTVLLKFSTNAHPYPNKLKYQYRLNKDEPWSLSSSKPEIFLASLPTKKHELDVKVMDKSTGLSHIQPLLSLTVLPPFWKTWWFILLLLSIMIAIGYSFYKIQIRQAKKFEAQKGVIQKRFEETKMEALLAQMNPHFIFNAMNSIQYYIMDNDIDKATIFLGDFSKLIRLNLDHCTKPTILLIEEIEHLQSYIKVENTRFDDRVEVIFETDPLIDPYEIEIPSMLLQTFVENVFVHAFPMDLPNPTLKVSFKLFSEGILQCKIEDNGIGFSKNSTNKLHNSKGVALVKERLAFLGYDIEEAVTINSARNKGTAVTLKLKI